MRNSICFAAAALLAVAGCSEAQRERFDNERAEKDFQTALADYTAGRIDAAEKGYRAVVEKSPSNASAHFNLAVLLQDARKDYLGAICHYRMYAMLAPGSDKIDIAARRAAACEPLLAKSMAERMNLTDNSELSAQLESALADLEKTKAEAESLRKETESLRRELAVEKKQSGERRRVLDSLAGLDDDGEAVKVSSAASSDDDSGAPAVASIPSVDDGSASPGVSSLPSEEDAGARPGVRTIPSELLDDGGGPLVLNPEAAALNDEAEAEESSLLPRRETVVGGSRLSDFGKSRGEEESAPAATTYVVQEGDTLMKIAKKHYGRKSAWTRIRDANRTTLTGDTIRPGQILKLP